MTSCCRCILIITLLGVVPGGCLGPRRSDYVSSRKIAVTEPSDEADALWEAAQDALRRHRFRLDRVDRRQGVITTMPETSQHFFEVWRHDVDTKPDLWEAILNPIRRRVEVRVESGEEGTWTEVACAVRKERFSSPDRQFNSTGAAYQYFSDQLPSTTGLVRVTAEHDRWLDIGRDPAMEDYLLRTILQRAGTETTATPKE